MTNLDDRVHQAIGDILDLAPPPPDRPMEIPPARAPNPWIRLAAAAAVVGVGVAGIAVVVTRDDSTDQQTTPTMVVGPATIPADGRMTLDPVPEGHQPGAAFGRRNDPSAAETRIYAADHETPEQGPAFFVRAATDDEPHEGDGADEVTVQSVDGFAWTDDDQNEHVSFGPVDGIVYYLDGYGVGRETLLGAAETAGFTEEHGPTLSLARSVTELTVGSYNETSTFTPATGEDAVGSVVAYWGAENGLWLSYHVKPEYGNLFAVNRLAHDSVTDVEIAGHEGYVFVDEFPNGDVSVEVVWTDGERTVFLSGRGYTEEELVAIAETLRPATDEEWSAMLLAGDSAVGGDLNAPPTPTQPGN